MKMILTPSEVRMVESAMMQEDVSSYEMMQAAAEGIFKAAAPWSGKIGILCGGGNNAGDGYALALLLKRAGCTPVLLRATDRIGYTPDDFYRACLREGIDECTPDEIDSLSDCTRLVDCLFGIGFHGALGEPYTAIAEWCNRSGIEVIAADIPSGLNALTGQVEGEIDSGVVKATMTVAIGAYKPSHFIGVGPDVCGRLAFADLHFAYVHQDPTVNLIEGEDIASLFAPRPHTSHKGSYGTTLLLGGSTEYSGAPKLSNLAAASLASMRSGCGIARLAVPDSLSLAVAPYLLESTLCPMPQVEGKMVFDRQAIDRAFSGIRSAAIGMGWGRSDEYADILTYVLRRSDIPIVIDADGLNTLARCDLKLLDFKPGAPAILTPHPKEFERLSGIPMAQVLADPIGSARAFAEQYCCIVLLKGSGAVVTDGNKVLVTNRGCGGMATAGSGDVLSGILAALLAWSPLDTLTTVAAGAYLAGIAGEIAEARVGAVSMIASDTVAALPEAIKRLCSTYNKKA